MLEFDNVSFSYNGQPLIENLSARFEKEKITTIIGLNGCGKSTLLKLGARLLTPKSGRIFLKGRDIRPMKSKAFARAVAMLSQSNFPSQMTVENAVLCGRYPHRAFGQTPSKADLDMVRQAMTWTCCEAFAKQEMSRLSGGERQRVFLAIVLAQDTDLIFLDEPLTYLDIHVCYELMEQIANLNKQMGKTLVLVLHDLNLALKYSDKLVLMDKGRIFASGTAQEMLENNWIQTIFKVNAKCFSDQSGSYFCFDKNI